MCVRDSLNDDKQTKFFLNDSHLNSMSVDGQDDILSVGPEKTANLHNEPTFPQLPCHFSLNRTGVVFAFRRPPLCWGGHALFAAGTHHLSPRRKWPPAVEHRIESHTQGEEVHSLVIS